MVVILTTAALVQLRPKLPCPEPLEEAWLFTSCKLQHQIRTITRFKWAETIRITRVGRFPAQTMRPLRVSGAFNDYENLAWHHRCLESR